MRGTVAMPSRIPRRVRKPGAGHYSRVGAVSRAVTLGQAFLVPGLDAHYEATEGSMP
jgi:hypothetical protein